MLINFVVVVKGSACLAFGCVVWWSIHVKDGNLGEITVMLTLT